MRAAAFTRWIESSAVPTLEPGVIQVWRVHLAGQSGAETRLNGLLSSEERIRAGRFHFAHDRRRFVIRRAVLRQLLAVGLRTTPSAVQLEFGTHGKPAVSSEKTAAGLRFSCSHSADWALIALARGCELGVDLEQHRPLSDAEDLAQNIFSPVENNELAELPSELKTMGFFNGWTRKEAFVKAIGLGLSYPLTHFSVSLTPDKPAALLEVADDAGAQKKWGLVSLNAVPNYSAALVFEGKQICLKCLTWNGKI